VIATFAFFVAGCAGPRLPTGVGTPNVADTVRFVDAVGKRCAEFESWTGEIAVDGIVAGRSVHGRLLGAFTRSNVRLEALSSSGHPPLVVISDATKAILRSPARTFEVSDSRDVIQALIGVRIAPHVLGQTLVACEFPEGFSTLRMFGPLWARLPVPGGGIYLHRAKTAVSWQLVTMFYPGETLHWAWRVDYEDIENGIPLRSHLVSAVRHTDLHFQLSQVDTMVAFQNDDLRFRIDGSPDARTTTPEQLHDIVDQWLGVR